MLVTVIPIPQHVQFRFTIVMLVLAFKAAEKDVMPTSVTWSRTAVHTYKHSSVACLYGG